MADLTVGICISGLLYKHFGSYTQGQGQTSMNKVIPCTQTLMVRITYVTSFAIWLLLSIELGVI